MKLAYVLLLISAIVLVTGCADSSPAPDPTADGGNAGSGNSTANVPEQDAVVRVVIQPGPDAQTEAQEALVLAEPGDVIEFSEGTFEFDGTLSLDGVNDVTIHGKGMEKTILNFAKLGAGKGGEGLKIKSSKFLLEDLTIEDTPGDAIKLQDCEGLTIRRVRTWWTGGPDAANGAYGLYPVMCSNVLIEHCVAECAGCRLARARVYAAN
ncbi:hypothetical protein Poly51_28710 [Rubripirellula tenax]|uniref:Pectate lyase n=1 Tax=Rubripirellula tenax TaxID=2528015 RepID=A0A5C6F7K6_9BACT|nr:hypothetical protein [Rubripirellula tenax]TWU56952.1 hypothetical protein Poly51_28710 [Rubripirellula tenax]